MQVEDKWSQEIACRDLHNLPKIDNLLLVESRHIQTDVVNLCIDHEYHLKQSTSLLVM